MLEMNSLILVANTHICKRKKNYCVINGKLLNVPGFLFSHMQNENLAEWSLELEFLNTREK